MSNSINLFLKTKQSKINNFHYNMKPTSKQSSSKKISAADSQFMKIAKASYSFAKKNDDLIATVEKRAKLLDSMFSKKHASLKSSDGLKDLSKKIASTSNSIKASISEISDKLDAAYICSVKASSDQQRKIASQLIKAHALDLETLSQHQVYFDLLSKKVAADLAEQDGEITDEQFLEIDENGYIEEPDTILDEAEEFNETFTSEDDKDEEKEEEETEDKGDEKESFDNSFDDEEMPEEMPEEMDEFPSPEFDEENLNEDSQTFSFDEELDDASILDSLEEPSDEIIEEDMQDFQSKKMKATQKASQVQQKEKKLSTFCTPQSTKHSSKNPDEAVMKYLFNS